MCIDFGVENGFECIVCGCYCVQCVCWCCC